MEKEKKLSFEFTKGIAWGILICALITILFGCKTKYVPVESVRTVYRKDTVFDTRATAHLQHIIDSFMAIRSVNRVDCFIIVKDTAGIVKYHGEWHRNALSDNTYHNIESQDSTNYYRDLYYSLQRSDSTKTIIPIEKKITWWNRLKIEYGGYAMFVVLFGMVIVIWLIRKRA